MSDEKYTEKEREFLRLHELGHTLHSIERTITEQFGERCPDYEATCIVCRAWKALDMLREVFVVGADADHATVLFDADVSDEKYTELERLSQQRLRVTQRDATRLFSLKDQLERLHRGLYNKAADKVVEMSLISYEGNKADYANMTAQEIFQDLIAPTTEDNDERDTYANMTAPEIFQDLIARKWQDALAQGKGTSPNATPTTEDNDDE